MRAEIEVPEINAEEAASLKASIASPDAFRTAGLEYNPAMASLQVSLQRRADGRAYIRLSSDRAINDPFVDMILVASWATGRIVRDYTLLFDPPSLRQAATTAPTPAQVPGQVPAPSSASRAAPVAPAPSRPIAAPARPAVEPAPSPVKPPARRAADKAPDAQARSVAIKPGDTASKIATATKPANVSLDQMLVALLRANPDAFIGDNVNRVKAGSVVSIPTAAQAEATPAGEARQIIIAQSKDFNDFRRKLAAAAPSAQVAGADRKASGSVQAQVEDKKPLTAVPDKLTLSKGTVQGASAEAQLAQERNAKEAAGRATEIAKNISDLGKLGAASSAAMPALSAPDALPTKPGPASSAAAVTAPIPAAMSAAASASAAAPPAAVSTAASAPSAVEKIPAVTPASPPEPGLLDDMTESPLALSGALGLVALLVAFGLYRTTKRKKAAAGESSFLDSHLQPDSFFGASGGESVDTSDNAATGSSMVYSPSQLDAVDDVDPVAEADVYLAYGRDMQAEEILKDALVSSPGRLAIHQKLLEIFAKRRDTQSFENMATRAFRVTEGQGPEWERICLLGLSIDPSNALYQPGGEPNNPDGTPSRPMTLEQTGSPAAGMGAVATQVIAPQTGGAADLDLDLDFSLDEEPVSAISEIKPSYTEPTSSLQAVDAPPVLDLDFGLDEGTVPFATAETAVKTAAAEGIGAIEFSLPDLDAVDNDQSQPAAHSDDFKLQAANSFGLTSPVPLPNSEPPAPAAPDLGMLEFDLGSLSLDLGDEAPTDTAASPMVNEYEDPLVTKLALAEEFRAIGDEDGARALIEEVISEASGDMKIKAQRALSNL